MNGLGQRIQQQHRYRPVQKQNRAAIRQSVIIETKSEMNPKIEKEGKRGKLLSEEILGFVGHLTKKRNEILLDVVGQLSSSALVELAL